MPSPDPQFRPPGAATMPLADIHVAPRRQAARKGDSCGRSWAKALTSAGRVPPLSVPPASMAVAWKASTCSRFSALSALHHLRCRALSSLANPGASGAASSR
jgi:hypothetical protein